MTQNQLNQDDPKNCYLISSNTFTKDEIGEDTLIIWDEYLDNEGVNAQFKDVVKEILRHFKISHMKFLLNDEYFHTPSPALSSFDPYLYIAPSLKRLKQMESNIPLGYPRWFISAFPDVAFWAMSERNQIQIMNIVKNDNDSRYININSLKKIIELYQSVSKNSLECKFYKQD